MTDGFTLPTPSNSATCSCDNSKDHHTCTCQAEHACKCAPDSCTCPECPTHKTEQVKGSKPCTCKPNCGCEAGKCECGECENSNKNK